jgi:uncharacterized membrane protein YdjX (TVP38/TMEM64 family)
LRRSKALVIGVLALGVAIGLLFLPVREWFEAARGYIDALGPAGPVAFVLGYALLAICLIPGSALTIGAGALFGLWEGLVLVIIGANLGAIGSFLLARTLLRARVQRWAASNPKFEALDRAIGREGFKTVLLSRLSPAFPFTVLNYVLGLTKVRLGDYVLANALGMIPGTFLYVYLGYLGPTVASDGTGGVGIYQRVLLVVGLCATVAIIVVVTRAARRALSEVESRPDDERVVESARS